MRLNGRAKLLLHLLALTSMTYGLLCVAGMGSLPFLMTARIAASTGGKTQFLTIQAYVQHS